ncbi:protein phosphatase 2C domain-containing protein [Haloechinothrix sp. LS1_15]|uniref:PP2C family protein-serine/threonine phosphatase n=1 Tax=Haloechinothrix sp. LS1_15 TaxID=2652248 RepID=UPI002948105B|nr:protein phosphatase 2C domain-containing protein [Haloechinothrix sp. LS1_15]MDV6012039.1 hypothetical protein [Haloechinothrix sp. LS1_15]
MTTTQCPACHEPVWREDVFCEACGERLATGPAATPYAAPAAHPMPPPAPPPPPVPAAPPTSAIDPAPDGEPAAALQAERGADPPPDPPAEPAGVATELPSGADAPARTEIVWPATEPPGEASPPARGAGPRFTVTPVGGAIDDREQCVHCAHPTVDEDGYCEQCGLRQPVGRERMSADLGVVAGVSDRGRVRDSNADAMAFGFTGESARPDHVVAIVCDGVGSGAHSGQAAQDAADAGAAELLGCLADGLDPRKASTMAMAAAADAVTSLAGGGLDEVDAPATTYVSVVATSTEVTVAWLGDSRAYWVAAGTRDTTAATDGSVVDGAACLTIDHTVRNSYLADGTRAAHTLTRWLGADSDGMDPQIVTVHPARPGVVVLCTDGLWGYLGDPAELAAEILGHRDAAEATLGLVEYALASGGRDNVAVIALPFPAAGGWP